MKNGFSLFELLMTIALVAAGLASLLYAMSMGLFAGAQNENEVVAVNLAHEKLEEIRNKAFASISAEAKAAVTGFTGYSREVLVSTIASLKQVTVNVYWFAKANELNENLVSYVSDI